MDPPDRELGLIVTVGTQSEQIAFQLEQLRPTHVAFIATNTQMCLKQVDDLVQRAGLRAQCHQSFCTQDNPDEIGRVVDNCFAAFRWLTDDRGVPPSSVHVDCTGGRKWMAAAALLAASELGLAVDYVHVDTTTVLDPTTRRERTQPDPATMRSIALGDVYELLRLSRINSAIGQYNAHDYAGAEAALEEIRRRTAGSAVVAATASALAKTSALAAALDGFRQFRENLGPRFDEAIRELRAVAGERGHLRALNRVADRLERLGEAFLGEWQREPTHELAPCLVLSAKRHERRGLLEVAILHYYRALELASQVWLWARDVNTAEPDWNALPADVVERYRARYGTGPISLVAGYALLAYLGCEEVQDVIRHDKERGPLPKFEGALSLRNHIVAEHGFRPVTPEEVRKLAKYAVPIAERVSGMTEAEMEERFGIPDLPPIGRPG